MKLDQEFWENRYREGTTPWDAGSITEPIRAFAEQLPSKDIRILIPGAGNAHEAQWLWQAGFKKVFVLDWAAGALQNLQAMEPDFPSSHLIQGDFFAHEGEYDLILEQTFFCALPPNKRAAYALHMYELLAEGGTLAGVLFSFPLTDQGPPFGGSALEYEQYFEPFFQIKTLEACYNSIKPRSGNELFIQLIKK